MVKRKKFAFKVKYNIHSYVKDKIKITVHLLSNNLNIFRLKMRYNILLIALFMFLSSYFSTAQITDRLPCVDKKFSVVIHVVKDSIGGNGVFENAPTAQIETAIREHFDTLNVHFAPVCMSFEICEFRYIENYLYYYHLVGNAAYDMMTLYNVEKRINVYYTAGIGAIGSIVNPNFGGVILPRTDKKSILSGFGSYFGLLPAEGDLAELVNGSNSTTAGDKTTDTPADPFVPTDNDATIVDTVYIPTPVCKYLAKRKDANGQYYRPILGNAMSGYNCICNAPDAFTREQYKKMANTYLLNPVMW